MKTKYIELNDAVGIADGYLDSGSSGPDVAQDIIAGLLALPSADVIPVVRCKNCVSAWDRDGDGRLFCTVPAKEVERKPDFFCAYGQRRA